MMHRRKPCNKVSVIALDRLTTLLASVLERG